MKEEKSNLVEKLRRVPKGTKLYSKSLGECIVKEIRVCDPRERKIYVASVDNVVQWYGYLNNGKGFNYATSECMLFPSKTQQNWDLFHYAKAGEYVTVESSKSLGNEIKYVCQVERDGIFDVKNSNVVNSYGVIGDILRKVRESTCEEIESMPTNFNVGDIVVARWGEIAIVFKKKKCLLSLKYCIGQAFLAASSRDVRHAKPDEINEWKEKLRTEHNAMLKDDDIVPWRAEKGGVYCYVSDYGKLTDDIDSRFFVVDNLRYNLHKTGITNYFATRELALKSEIYKFFHP